MGSRLRLLASQFRQAVKSPQSAPSSFASNRLLFGEVMSPCYSILLPWTGRQSFSACATHSSLTSCSLVGRKPIEASNFSVKRLPGARSLLLRSAGSTPGRAFRARAAHQQQPAPQDEALLQSASAMRSLEASTVHQPSASTSAQAQASVEGTIQRITYSSEETGYTVARMKVDKSSGFTMPTSRTRSTNDLVTVTGKFSDMAVGQQWKCDGSWTKHKTWGPQLVATMAEEVRPTSSGDLIAYLCGGATKGVGPVTAGNMVQKYGDAILDVLDSEDAAQKLTRVKGIGAKTAAKIKDEWEKRRGIVLCQHVVWASSCCQ